MSANRTLRWTTIGLCIGVLAYLAAFALRFADERLYADSGYYLFWTINDLGFHIEHGRWVLALAEWPALLGAMSDSPMSAAILAHSLANVIFLVLTMCFALYVLKDERAALALAASQLIGLTHGLFCPVFELYYGTGLIILLHAVVVNALLNGRIKLLLALMLFILALSSHPMAWLLLLGMLALLDPRDRRPMLLPLLLAALLFAVLRWYGMSVYESAQLGFAKRLISFAPLRLLAPQQLWHEARRFVQHDPDVLALAATAAIILARARQWRPLIIHLSGIVVLYILTGLYLPDAPHDRYHEQVDFGFAAWTVLVLFSSCWAMLPWRPAILTLVMLGFAYRIAEAERIAPYYTARTAWLEQLIQQAKDEQLRKAIIDPHGISFGTADDRVAPYWSPGVETLLLSARQGPDQAISVITTDDFDCPGVTEKLDKLVLRCWDVIEPERVNKRFFDLPASQYAPLVTK
ncbi:MAG: hypothetical protein H6591_10415 [Flavobacteriales bacterium]|nr:hypothetical protein [Flavobacteriales bacterium]